MSTATLSIQISLGVHVAAFVLALAFSGFSSSLPHYHLRQGGPIVLEGSFAVAEPTSVSYYLTLPPAADYGESISAATVELTAAAMDVRPVRTSIESSVADIKLPGAIDDCKCEAPEHEIQTPKRSLDAAPEFVSSIEPPPELRRRELTDAGPSVSTEVTLPPSLGNGGTDVDVLPRKISANRPPPYPAGAFQRGEQGRVILEVLVNARGMVESLRVVESSGVDSLDEAALKAVREWRFEPGYRGGFPVEALVNVPVRFAIR
jgi:TonB family protein